MDIGVKGYRLDVNRMRSFEFMGTRNFQEHGVIRYHEKTDGMLAIKGSLVQVKNPERNFFLQPWKKKVIILFSKICRIYSD